MSTSIDTVQQTHRIVPTSDGYKVERREFRQSHHENGNSVTRTQQWVYEVYNRWGQIETPPTHSVNINT